MSYVFMCLQCLKSWKLWLFMLFIAGLEEKKKKLVKVQLQCSWMHRKVGVLTPDVKPMQQDLRRQRNCMEIGPLDVEHN